MFFALYRSLFGKAVKFLFVLNKILSYLNKHNLKIVKCADLNTDIRINSKVVNDLTGLLKSFYVPFFFFCLPTGGKSCIDNVINIFGIMIMMFRFLIPFYLITMMKINKDDIKPDLNKGKIYCFRCFR